MPERPSAAQAAVGAQQTVTMLCLLSGSDGSGYSHDYISRTVTAWAAEKFPRLVGRARPRDRSFTLEEGPVRIDVHAGEDELFSWTFRCEHPETGGARRWVTEVCLANFDGADQLGVRNGFLGEGPRSVKPTQPRFLRPLVDHLTYRDAGIRVATRPLFAQGPQAFENFLDHLQSRQRTLPLVALPPQARQHGEEPRYGTNPWTLAQWLCGLAHVVVLADYAEERFRRQFGPAWELPAGCARVLHPGFSDDDPGGHPVLEPATESPLALHDALATLVYGHSTRGARRGQFQELWERCDAR